MNRAIVIVVASLLLIAKQCEGFGGHPFSFVGRINTAGAWVHNEISCPPSKYSFKKRVPSSLYKMMKPGDDAPVLEEKAVTSMEVTDEECVVPEELSETKKLLKQVKEAGTAGVVSYALWELGFWTLSVPVCVFGYREVTGHWPDFSNQEDLSKLGAEAFAFVNFARFAVPLRIGLALGTTPWIQANVIDRFFKKDEPPACEEPET